ncbi:MAG: glycosyltransferase family 4 protein [Prevotella sp.]|jgi:glycosyltransferase involved in cell wall biosynthesis|nr:glycosyltransferase family 4 protein [Prevotella sp.]
MKKICWVTPDWFVDVDMPIIPHLLDEYDITWIIFFPWRNNRYREEDFDYLQNKEGLKIIFFHLKYYRRDPRCCFRKKKLTRLILSEAEKADIIYYNVTLSGAKPSKVFLGLPKEKTIVTAHDGSIKSIMADSTTRLYKECYPQCKHIQMFSESQALEFRKNYPGPQVTVIPLAKKDYGQPTANLREDCVSFVSFGTIHAEKNIPMLIQAADELYDEGLRGFKVLINGQWKIEQSPEELCRHPEIFEIHVGLVDNKDIPNLFARNTFIIYPYKMMSQSGALKVAFNYYKPVVVSDLPGFKEEVEDGINGFFFHSEDVESLKKVMKACIALPNDDYTALVASSRRYIDGKYSTSAIVNRYKAMFKGVLYGCRND